MGEALPENRLSRCENVQSLLNLRGTLVRFCKLQGNYRELYLPVLLEMYMNTNCWFNKTRARLDPVAYVSTRTQDKTKSDGFPDFLASLQFLKGIALKSNRQLPGTLLDVSRLRHPTFQRIFGRAEENPWGWTYARTAALRDQQI